LDFVRGHNASRTTFCNPLRVKFANVGDIIPPCGVPLIVGSNISCCQLLEITPLFSQLSININPTL
jgi:hypothetical protein